MSPRWAFSWREARTVLAHVALVLLALELIYLVVANSVLKSSVIKHAVSGADGMYLEYGSAFSWLPGRAHVEDLSLRIEDYNVQFLLKIERAEVDVGLDELLHKRFHAFRVRADGVSFLMRHKVRQAEGHGERLAAFPKIAGFADPPLFVGPEPPPIPDDQYDLWQVHLEDVVAHAKELWFLEYRFRGDAEARGAFSVRPARLVQVEPARLELRSGSLSLGPHAVARSVKGNISVSVPNLQVPKVEGLAVLREISAQADVQLGRGDLDFIEAYRDPGGPSVRGTAAWSIRARLQRGVVQPGTSLKGDATTMEVTIPGKDRPNLVVAGPLEVSAAVTESSPQQLSLATGAAALVLRRVENGKPSGMPSPTIEQASLTAALQPVDLSQKLRIVSLHSRVARAHVPNLYWFQPWLSPDDSLRVDGVGDASFEAACDEQQLCQVERARVDFVGARLGVGDRASEPVSGSFDAENVLLPWHETKLAGQAQLQVSSAPALLPLVTSLPVKDAIASALGLAQVRARFALSGTSADYRIRLLEARSGGLSARGSYRRQQKREHGVLLLSTEAINVGVTLKDGDSDVSLLVGDDWLTRQPD
jgi:hypothetical protein